jgi:hypothetical protein
MVSSRCFGLAARTAAGDGYRNRRANGPKVIAAALAPG